MRLHWSAGYVGLGYRRHGRTRPLVDCLGLVRLALVEAAGLALPDWLDDGPEEGADWRRVDRPRGFDVAVFRGPCLMRHVGLMIDAGRMLHIRDGSLSRIDPVFDRPWVHRLEGFFRHEALA